MASTIWVMCGLVCFMHAISGEGLNCPRGYNLTSNGSCYLFSHDAETWTGAMISCQVLEGHLVEINTAYESSFLQAQAEFNTGHNQNLKSAYVLFANDARPRLPTTNYIKLSDQDIMLFAGAPDHVSRWIGLSDKRAPGEWEWGTSHTLLQTHYINWAPGEPDQYGHTNDKIESCVLMDQPNHHHYQWADVQCERLEKYICEAEPYQLPVVG